MVDAIKGASKVITEAAALDARTKGPGKGGFEDMLKESLDKVNNLQAEADKKIEGLVAGRGADLHDTMIAVEKADLSFNLMVQVRNKLLAAYEEIMRMQV